MLNDEWKNIVAGAKLEEFTSISSMSQYKIQVALEILEGCSYMCPRLLCKKKRQLESKIH